MGMYLSLIAAVLVREEEQFVQRNEILQFEDEVYVAWCRSPRRDLPPGWETRADETLQVRYQPDRWREYVEHETSPVYPESDPNLFSYAEMFDVGHGMSALFHLVLPPRHLPRFETFQPFPSYARSERERFVLGWIRQSNVWIRFTFAEVTAEAFAEQATALRRAVIEQQATVLEDEAELPSIEAKLRTWHGNRRFLEEKAAKYGLDVPIHIYNELEEARAQIAALESRRTTLLPR